MTALKFRATSVTVSVFVRRGYQIESDFANTIAGASKAWRSRVAKRSLTSSNSQEITDHSSA